MAQLNGADVAALRGLPEWLRRAGYVDAFAVHGALHVRFDLVERQLAIMPEPLATLARLFLLGAAVPTATARAALPPAMCDALVRLGVLLDADGATSTAGLVLAPLLGQLAFVPRRTGAALLEQELVLAARATPPAGGRCLCLCASHGLVALRCATLAASVVAVEVNPILVGCIDLTLALNAVDDRAEIREGDLDEALASGQQFDYIVAEAPVMPFPPAFVSPTAAPDDDGAALAYRLLRGLPRALAPGGWAQILACCVGDDAGPHLARDLPALAGELGMRIVATIPGRISLAPTGDLFGLLTAGCASATGLEEAEIRARLTADFAARDVKHLYSVVLTLHPAAPSAARSDHFAAPGGGFWFR